MHPYIDYVVIGDDVREAVACFDRLLVLYDKMERTVGKHYAENEQADDWAIELGPPRNRPYAIIRGVKFPARSRQREPIAADLRYNGTGGDS